MMLKNRFLSTAATVALCGALVAPAGCKKKEEAKPAAAAPAGKEGAVKADEKAAAAPAAPVLPDVELQAGEGVVGWLSLKSFNGLFDLVESVGGKLGALPPGASVRGQVTTQLTAVLAQAGIKDIAWLDMTRPLHVGYHEQPAPAADPAAAPGAAPAPGADPAAGVFVVLPITGKDAALAAMTTAKKDAEAEGHAAMIATPAGEKVFFDFLDKHVVITVRDKDRYGKVGGFAKRIAAIEPPAVAYLGVSIDDLMKTHKPQVDAMLDMITKNAAAAGADGRDNAKAAAASIKLLRELADEATRFEVLVGGDPTNLHFEGRVQAKEGTKLAKRLNAGRGHVTRDIANLAPANSYLSFSVSNDAAVAAEQLQDNLAMLKDMLQADAAQFDQFSKDLADLTKLMDGNSTMAVYPDGTAAVGVLAVGGVTDGDAADKVGKRVMGDIIGMLVKLVQTEKSAQFNEEETKLLAAVEQAGKEGKLEPVLTALAPKLDPAGIKLTANSSKDGDIACDVLDITLDYTKVPAAEGSKLKAVAGEKPAFASCHSKTKTAFAFGAGALEKAKAGAAGKVGGLADAPVYKAAVGNNDGPAVVYLNIGAMLAALKPVLPAPMEVPADKAIFGSCVNRTKSYACGADLPVDMVKAILEATRGPAPGQMPGGVVAPVPGAAPAPTGGAVAPAAPQAPAPTK